ncbi:hypothetical protein CDD80_2564 [Ophiocordyceps camponoti-rufipedis]|uniref:Uncharacterized protein n=1 Tax=Ophiocordyceps camponoti-rufipedis TaxID=2004952 RepID=A0A2C5ZK22_9HYPO|nr:hypothetical protein CDD80_2564 [Ophiocordyceps camponoti-rufipedis]
MNTSSPIERTNIFASLRQQIPQARDSEETKPSENDASVQNLRAVPDIKDQIDTAVADVKSQLEQLRRDFRLVLEDKMESVMVYVLERQDEINLQLLRVMERALEVFALSPELSATAFGETFLKSHHRLMDVMVANPHRSTHAMNNASQELKRLTIRLQMNDLVRLRAVRKSSYLRVRPGAGPAPAATD